MAGTPPHGASCLSATRTKFGKDGLHDLALSAVHAAVTLWSAGPSAFSFTDGAVEAPPSAGSGTIDWTATSAAVQAHLDATGSWGDLSEHLVSV